MRLAAGLPVSLLPTLAVGVAGGWLGVRLGVPAGGLVGSMVATGAVRLLGGPIREMPAPARSGSLVLLGAALGASFGWSQMEVGRLLLPAVLLTAVLLCFSLAVAWTAARRAAWPWAMALLCTAPAGIAEISMAADEMGLDASTVATMHLVRLTTVVTVVPWIVRWLG